MFSLGLFAYEILKKYSFVIMIMLMLKTFNVFMVDFIWLNWNDKKQENLIYSKNY